MGIIKWSHTLYKGVDPDISEDIQNALYSQNAVPFGCVNWVVVVTDSCINYSDVIINAMASQITGVSIAFSTICSAIDQRKHQSSASLAFVREIPPTKGQ